MKRRATHVRFAHRPDTPGAVSCRPGLLGPDVHALSGTFDPAFPAAELRESRDIHEHALFASQGLTLLFKRYAAGRKRERTRERTVVGGQTDPEGAHRLQDVDAKRPHLEHITLVRCAPRPVKAVLHAVAHDADGAIHDAPVRIQAQRDPEVERSVCRKPVEPVAVVGVAVIGDRMRNRLRGLVQRVVVEAAQHAGSGKHDDVTGNTAARQRRKALIDLFELDTRGNQAIQVQPALLVELDKLGHVHPEVVRAHR